MARALGHEAARVGSPRSGGHTACGPVDGRRVPGIVQPAGEIVPTQVVHHRVSGRVVSLEREVKFAEQGAFVALLRQQLGRGHFVGGDHGVGEVIGAQRALHIGTQRKAAVEEHGAARRAGRHGPRIAEADASTGDGVHVWRVGRRRPAVAEDSHLVDAHVIHNNEQDVRPRRRWRRRVAGELHPANSPNNGRTR